MTSMETIAALVKDGYTVGFEPTKSGIGIFAVKEGFPKAGIGVKFISEDIEHVHAGLHLESAVRALLRHIESRSPVVTAEMSAKDAS